MKEDILWTDRYFLSARMDYSRRRIFVRSPLGLYVETASDCFSKPIIEDTLCVHTCKRLKTDVVDIDDVFEMIMNSVHSYIHESQKGSYVEHDKDVEYQLCSMIKLPVFPYMDDSSSYLVKIRELNKILRMIKISISRNLVNPVKKNQETYLGYMLAGKKWDYCITTLQHLIILSRFYEKIDITNPTLDYIKNVVQYFEIFCKDGLISHDNMSKLRYVYRL